KRVEKMFGQGLVTECRRLRGKKISRTASQILGLKEIFMYLDKKCTKPEAKELLKKNTRHYAKRQLSWFRNDKRVMWIDVNKGETPKQIAERIAAIHK
ncbi:MAG: tRNA (adenosine(37)-N6)-dimethylallyltransferase MiaA, partial [Candidatus Omnitrophica bacterium]|nr:tRNA (adenosine(37)-N6)-dimethylallyltransferase MiaA [Candidatus Omnitrophota bacterium]